MPNTLLIAVIALCFLGQFVMLRMTRSPVWAALLGAAVTTGFLIMLGFAIAGMVR